jgi:hypothetical protein
MGWKKKEAEQNSQGALEGETRSHCCKVLWDKEVGAAHDLEVGSACTDGTSQVSAYLVEEAALSCKGTTLEA